MDGGILSKRDAGRVQGMLRWFERSGRQSPRFRRRKNPDDGIIIRIFEVQSAATGDGLYICYRQKLDATNWADEGGLDKLLDYEDTPTEVTILNLDENDPVEGAYTPALAAKDRIVAWQMSDDESNLRWVGIPLTPSPRRARTTAAAGAAITIVCNLIDREGNEIAAGLGSGITVNCDISTGNLEDAIRNLANNAYLSVEWIAGKWYAVEGFQAFNTDHFQITGGKLQDKLNSCA